MLKVQNDALLSTVAALERAHTEMASILTTLERDARVLSGQWHGDAQQAFERAQRSWASQMHMLTTLLSSARHALDATAASYENTERALERGWSI